MRQGRKYPLLMEIALEVLRCISGGADGKLLQYKRRCFEGKEKKSMNKTVEAQVVKTLLV